MTIFCWDIIYPLDLPCCSNFGVAAKLNLHDHFQLQAGLLTLALGVLPGGGGHPRASKIHLFDFLSLRQGSIVLVMLTSITGTFCC